MNSQSSIVWLLVLAASTLGVLAGPALAQEEKKQGLLHSRFQVRGGAFFAFAIDSSVQIAVDDVGDDVDFESDLNLDDNSIDPFVSFLFRFNPRHAISGDWFASDRTDRGVAGFNIDIDGEIIPVNADIKTNFEFNLFRIAYEYSLVHNDKWEVALSAGGHYIDFDFKLDDMTFGTPTIKESDSGFFPNIGAVVRGQLAPKVATQARILWFGFNDIDKYNGAIFLGEASIEHQTTKHLGFGASLRYFNMNFGRDGNRKDWQFRFRDVGPTIYALVTF